MSIRFSKAIPVALGAVAALSLSSPAQQFVLQNGAVPGTKRWSEGVEAADVDNDGDLDIFFAEGEGFSSAGTKRQNILLINKTETTPGLLVDESVMRLRTNVSNAKSVDTGDLDGDGYTEAMFANAFNTNPPFLYMNAGTIKPGFFKLDSAARGFTTSYSSACSNFGDLDNDGDLDVIISDSGNSFLGGVGDKPHLFFNDGNGFFTENAAALGAPTKKAQMDVQYADMDGDWDLDFVGFNRGSNANGKHFLMLNDGLGNFTDASTLFTNTSNNVYEGELGDLDGDADMDMFLVSLSGFSEGSIRNNLNPSGTLSLTNGGTLSGDDDNEIVLLDYDNDGDFDVVVGSLGSREKMYRNNGNGAFSNAAGVFTVKGDSTLDATAFDIDNDGDYDVVTAQGESGSNNWDNKLYLNNGAADMRAPVIVREENVAAMSAAPWIIRSETRDQVMDDGNNWVTADLDYVVNTSSLSASVSTPGLTFAPGILNVAPGTTVTWTNTGGPMSVHTVTSSTPGYEFDSGNMAQGQTFSYTFVREGTYDYFCTPHLQFGMTGQVIVSAGASKGKVLDMGGGGMTRFEMSDTQAGAGIELVYERRFTDWAGNVTVSPAQVVTLAAGPAGYVVYGTGASAANYMTIAGNGAPAVGANMSVDVSNVTQTNLLLLVSSGQANFAGLGGVILADFSAQLTPLIPVVSAGGNASVPFLIPNIPALAGIKVYFQYGCVDAGQAGGFGFSDGLEATILP